MTTDLLISFKLLDSTTINDGLMIPEEIDPMINVLGKGLSDDWLSRIDIANTSSNSKKIRRSAATTRGGSTGLVVGRIAEVTQMSSTREVFETSNVDLDKMYIYSEVSEEDLEDFAYLESHLTSTAPELMRIKVGEEFLTGSGSGQALGMFHANNGDQVTVSARNTANDLKASDVCDMKARFINGPGSFWMVDHSVWAKLPLMTIGDQPVLCRTSLALLTVLFWVCLFSLLKTVQRLVLRAISDLLTLLVIWVCKKSVDLNLILLCMLSSTMTLWHLNGLSEFLVFLSLTLLTLHVMAVILCHTLSTFLHQLNRGVIQ